jgi:hypothetical protein
MTRSAAVLVGIVDHPLDDIQTHHRHQYKAVGKIERTGLTV